ncbi:SH2 domain-containing adapter protein B isoform X16 [Pipistrellus kuhlii]|uniref:SH2 domain-containing adapter protein B isoform X16 n=1 Tax=Pipistrellus kuhlii TaxID=59472 RepID=UPI00174F1339|nr:SH2 domain-containing adapter protein B isoform X16 [Pipistrellus kuhlii]
MAKWLNKYFSLGNSKTKSPPQPPRPDYREQRRRGGDRPSQQPPQAVPQASASSSASCGPAAASCFSALSGSLPDDSGSTSDLIRAYRAQKERDFEDPYNGPGSSLRKLRAMCRLDYCGGGGEPGGGQRAFSASSASGAAGCCCASSGAGAAAASSSSGSPHLYRSSSERRPATPAEVRYISPKHRLIKVESAVGSAAGDPSGGACSGGRTWSPTACGGKKLLNKCAASAAEESGSGKKEKNFRGRKASGPSTKASSCTTPLTNPRAKASTRTRRAQSAPDCGRASCPRMTTGPPTSTTSRGSGTGSPSQPWQMVSRSHQQRRGREPAATLQGVQLPRPEQPDQQARLLAVPELSPVSSLKAVLKSHRRGPLSSVLDRSPVLPLTAQCVTLGEFLPSGAQHPRLPRARQTDGCWGGLHL